MVVLCPWLHRHNNIASLVLMRGPKKRNCLPASMRVKRGNSSILPGTAARPCSAPHARRLGRWLEAMLNGFSPELFPGACTI